MGINKIIILGLLLVIKLGGHSQNLVNNPSFEEYKKAPKKISQIENALYWIKPTRGTSDYFTKESSKIEPRIGVPKNKNGYQEPKSGSSYVGLLAQLGTTDGGEYIQTVLKSSLKASTKYCVKFYISLSDKSPMGSKSIGMFISKEVIKSKESGALPFKPQIETRSEEILSDKENWREVCGIYTAEGGEKALIIGTFLKEYNKIKTSNSAYYYIDDVSVIEVNNENKCDCKEEKKDSVLIKQFVSELNKPIILENIIFEFGKSELKESSFVELDQLVNELQENPSYKIRLSGHTDNIGREEDNLQLSHARAKAIADYLIDKEIDPTRIAYKGYGSKNPIADNETEEGREINRRVEFILSADEK